jgi:hypothetical protein
MTVQFRYPTGADEFNLGARIGSEGVDLYERQKAHRLQMAVEQARLASQQQQFQQTNTRLTAAQQALDQYRQDNLKQTGAHHQATEKLTADRNKALADKAAADDQWKQQQAQQHQQNWNADFARHVANDGSLDEYRKRSKSFQTDPQTHALEQQHKLIGDEWLHVSKALKSVSDPDGLGGPAAGHEVEYKAFQDRLQKLESERDGIGQKLRKRYASVATGGPPPAGGDDDQGGDEATSGATKGPPSGNPHVGDLGVRLPAGVRPFNAENAPPPAAPILRDRVNAAAAASGIDPANPTAGMRDPMRPGANWFPPSTQPANVGTERVPQSSQLQQGPAPFPHFGGKVPDWYTQGKAEIAQQEARQQQAAVPATAQVPAEQTRQWVQQYALEAGVKADRVAQLPPPTVGEVARLKAMLAQEFADPVKQYQEFYRRMILAGRNPAVPAVADPALPPGTGTLNLGGS